MEEKKNRNSMNFIELDQANNKKRQALKKKLDKIDGRKKEITQKNKEKIDEIMEKERRSLEKINEKKKKQEEEKQIYYNNILKYQSSVIKRSDIKESSTELSRSSA